MKLVIGVFRGGLFRLPFFVEGTGKLPPLKERV